MVNAKQLAIALATCFIIWLGAVFSKPLFNRISAKTAVVAATAVASPVVASTSNSIQVALLLDTSNSMDGLIEQAKSQLWKILNELNRMKKNGETPSLEIALYEYGNVASRAGEFQIRQLTPFTGDVDLVSEKLFSLRTNGGEEFCGAVIRASLDELEWKSDDGLKIIYIAGNEPFTQGPVGFKSACADAVEKGIIVNTIHCGDCETGRKENWQAGATAGGGEYLCIDQNRQTVYVQTPYDDQLNALNAQLNDTYIPLGKKGKEKKDNQTAQDANANFYDKSNAAERSAFKSSKNYKAEDWDMVDAYKKDKRVLDNKEALPDTFQTLPIAEMEAKIEAIAARRESVQQQMQELDAQRRAYIESQSSQQAAGGDLENSILQSLRKQAAAKGFEVGKS